MQGMNPSLFRTSIIRLTSRPALLDVTPAQAANRVCAFGDELQPLVHRVDGWPVCGVQPQPAFHHEAQKVVCGSCRAIQVWLDTFDRRKFDLRSKHLPILRSLVKARQPSEGPQVDGSHTMTGLSS